ncbi:hypothetical protein OAJ28_00520 [Flavobacteriaceae bacterium]|nr:hypothetical protein [Flavobacteriaceae bacterium]
MKNKLHIFLMLFSISLVWLMYSTGFFRPIDKKFDGNILKKVSIVGVEDITINQKEGFAIISSTKRKNLPPVEQENGDLYLIDLKNMESKPILLTQNFDKPFAPHGISIFTKDSITTIAAVNHTTNGEYIELFKLTNSKLTHHKTLHNDLIINPNDIVLLDEETFYFTNDHIYKNGFMRFIEEFLGLPFSNVIFYDGKKFKEAAKGISYANGINFEKDKNLVFVASPRKFKIKVYEKQPNNSLAFIEDIYCGSGVDNIEFDTNNNLWVGAHPNLLQFMSYSHSYHSITPSEIIKIQYFKKGDYKVETIYLEKGEEMSGSTVAAPFENLILMGNVMDKHFVILEKN